MRGAARSSSVAPFLVCEEGLPVIEDRIAVLQARVVWVAFDVPGGRPRDGEARPRRGKAKGRRMVIRVRCSCGQLLEAGDEHAGKQGRCPMCGAILPLTVTPAAEAQALLVAQPVYWPLFSPYGDEVYRPEFDLRQVDPQLLASWRARELSYFSVAGAVVLNMFTSSLFGLIFYGIQHGRLPRASRRDFGTGQAIGFMFIPFYNLYWAFRFWCGLVDRLNLQLRLTNHPVPPLSRSLATAVCVLKICSAIPYLGCLALIAEVICEAVLVSKVQEAINSLAAPYRFPYYQPYGYPPAYPVR